MKHKTATLFVIAALLLTSGAGAQLFAPSNPGKPVVALAPVVTQLTLTRTQALEKYGSCLVANPERMVSLQVARQVKTRLAAEGFDVSAGIFCNETKGGGRLAGLIPEADLVRDGFPADVPALLIIQDTDGDGHSVEQLQRWVNSGLWNWGLRWCLQRVW